MTSYRVLYFLGCCAENETCARYCCKNMTSWPLCRSHVTCRSFCSLEHSLMHSNALILLVWRRERMAYKKNSYLAARTGFSFWQDMGAGPSLKDVERTALIIKRVTELGQILRQQRLFSGVVPRHWSVWESECYLLSLALYVSMFAGSFCLPDCLCHILTVIFPGGPARNVSILDFIGAKDDGGGGDNWSYKTCKESSSQIITTNKPTSSFYRPDALPVAQPTVSEHWREIVFSDYAGWIHSWQHVYYSISDDDAPENQWTLLHCRA